MSNQPVYLIDQDDVVRDSLKVLLESHGFPVHDFASGADFLRAGHQPGGCLLIGCNRAVADGLELVEAARRRGWSAPAIFIVGGGGPAVRAMLHAAGAFAYLERPVREAALVKAVCDALARNRGRSAESQPAIAAPCLGR